MGTIYRLASRPPPEPSPTTRKNENQQVEQWRRTARVPSITAPQTTEPPLSWATLIVMASSPTGTLITQFGPWTSEPPPKDLASWV